MKTTEGSCEATDMRQDQLCINLKEFMKFKNSRLCTSMIKTLTRRVCSCV